MVGYKELAVTASSTVVSFLSRPGLQGFRPRFCHFIMEDSEDQTRNLVHEKPNIYHGVTDILSTAVEISICVSLMRKKC